MGVIWVIFSIIDGWTMHWAHVSVVDRWICEACFEAIMMGFGHIGGERSSRQGANEEL